MAEDRHSKDWSYPSVIDLPTHPSELEWKRISIPEALKIRYQQRRSRHRFAAILVHSLLIYAGIISLLRSVRPGNLLDSYHQILAGLLAFVSGWSFVHTRVKARQRRLHERDREES
jgi:hypothetical protein